MVKNVPRPRQPLNPARRVCFVGGVILLALALGVAVFFVPAIAVSIGVVAAVIGLAVAAGELVRLLS